MLIPTQDATTAENKTACDTSVALSSSGTGGRFCNRFCCSWVKLLPNGNAANVGADDEEREVVVEVVVDRGMGLILP